MKVTIAELRALAKRAGVRMYRHKVTGVYRIKWPWNEFRTSCNLRIGDIRIKVYYILKGIIAEREGLL